MALVKIQHRRGNYADYDPSKVLPGEMVVTLANDPNASDGRAVYIGTVSGHVKQLATVEDMEAEVATALDEAVPQAVTSATQQAEAAADRAEDAARTLTIDNTLTYAGQAADAKKTGDEITAIKQDLSEIEPGLSDDAKNALLNCFRHVAWVDADGQTYYDALEDALYADSYPRLIAVFNAGVNTIYTDDALDTLKQYLTVKYFATKESTGTVIASSDYTLSGVLVEGTSIVTVAYNGVRTSVSIPGVVDYYNIWNWSMANGDFSVRPGTIDYYSNETKVRYTFRTPWDTRRGVTAPKGLLPYRVWGTDTDMTSYYPIPIPKDANKVTISITPNTQYIYTQVIHVSDGNVTRIAQQGWAQGTTEVTFDKGENNAVFFNTKYDSDGSTYPTDPTEITVAFEEV